MEVSLHAVWVFKINFDWKHFIIMKCICLVIAIVQLELLAYKCGYYWIFSGLDGWMIEKTHL